VRWNRESRREQTCADVSDRWSNLCEELETCFPGAPEVHVWPKKFRWDQQKPRQRSGRNLREVMERVRKSEIRSCCAIESELFQDNQLITEEDFAPPGSPRSSGLEELIVLSDLKRRHPRLAERRIQVPGRRMEKFIPPLWKPSSRRVVKDDAPTCGMEGCEEASVAGGRIPIKAKALDVDTRSDRVEEREGRRRAREEGQDGDFFS
jgi:hypothetical protein